MWERVRVGELVAEQLGPAVREWAAALVRPIIAHAEEVVELSAPDHVTARWALLVSRDSISNVYTEVDRVRDQAEHIAPPCDIEYVGPLPPIDFATEALTTEGTTSRWGW
jgi:hypothetical protein